MSTSETSNKPLAPPHEVIVISDYPDEEAQLRQQCYDVRRDVFCTEQGFSPDLEVDQHDATATHFLLRLTPAHTPIGTLRLHQAADGSHLVLGRVAILAAYRKYGLGRALILAAHEHAVHLPTRMLSASPAKPQKNVGELSENADSANYENANTNSNVAAAENAADRSTITVKLGSQIPAMSFYARYGYVAEGDTYLDEGVPHMPMSVTLPCASRA